MVQGKKVDGLIVSYSKQADPVVPYLIECGIPIVVIGKPLGQAHKITYVDNDNVKAAREAAEYLIGRGHEKIAYVGGSLKYEVSKYRLQRFKEAVLLNQLDISEGYIKNPIWEAIYELIALGSPPSGIVAIDDLTAINALLVLKEKQIKIPDQVSLISFNHTIVSTFSNPAFTSIDTQIY